MFEYKYPNQRSIEVLLLIIVCFQNEVLATMPASHLPGNGPTRVFHFGSFSHCSWRTSKGQPCCMGSIRAQAVSKLFRDPLLGSGTWNTLRCFQLFLKLLLCIQVIVLFKCKHLNQPVPEWYIPRWVLVHWHTDSSNYLCIFILITLLSILTLGNPLCYLVVEAQLHTNKAQEGEVFLFCHQSSM